MYLSSNLLKGIDCYDPSLKEDKSIRRKKAKLREEETL
jgi:hypothetical protein